jgi:hypothetical protein
VKAQLRAMVAVAILGVAITITAQKRKLTHFAMLLVARHWTQQVIWDLHDESRRGALFGPYAISPPA